MVFLAVVVARLRVVVLAAGFASTVVAALGLEGVSSTLAAGFAAALVVADVYKRQGQVLVKAKRVYLGLSAGTVELLEVKRDVKRAMAASAWAAGLQGADLMWGVLS